jgi:trypsin
MRVSDQEAVSQAIEVKQRVRDRLLSFAGVHGVGVGCKFIAGKRTDELAIAVYVHKKVPLNDLPPDQVIPSEIEGFPTDVEELPVAECFDDTGRYRPLVGGSQLEYTTTEHPAPNTTVTHFNSGTLGCIARARRTGKNMILTNGHVAAGCGDPSIAISAGLRHGQPDDTNDCSCCSKCWATVVGTVVDAKVDPDAGLIQIDKCVDISPNIREIGAIHGVLTTAQIDALGNQRVQMRGAKTGSVKFGTVSPVSVDSNSICRESDDRPGIVRAYSHAIRVDADTNNLFGQRGDSGSAVLDMNGNLVGLLFAGFVGVGNASSYGVVARIDRILSEFQASWDLEVITAQNAAALGASAAAVTAPHAFSAIENAHPAIEGFQPTEEELELLGRARDEMLATPMGQRVSELIGRHVPEIQVLIRTRKRIAAVWRRVSAADLFQGLVEGIRSPEKPLVQFVQGAPLPERIAALSRVLTRYGSQGLVADLKVISALAADITSKSYGEVLAWVKTEPANQLEGVP